MQKKGEIGAALAPMIGQAVGSSIGTIPYILKSQKQRDVAKDTTVMSHGGDLSKLKTRNRGRSYNKFTDSGLAKDIVRQNRQKTACEIVSELFSE